LGVACIANFRESPTRHRVEVLIPAVEDEVHESLFVVQYTLLDTSCMRFGKGVQAPNDNTKVQYVAVGVVLSSYLETQGSQLQVQGSGAESSA
jgi:hypothetical protein